MPAEGFGEVLQDLAVVVGDRLQADAEGGPVVLTVEGAGDGPDEGVAVDFAAVGGGERGVVEGFLEVEGEVDDVLGVVAERAALPGAPGGEVLEGELEAAGLGEGFLHGVVGGVDDAVEYGAADVVREQVGVDAAEFGAVGDAEVVQLVVAEDVAQQVHVLGGLGGADVREDVAGVLLAGGRRFAVEPDEGVGLVAAVVGGPVDLVLVGEAGVEAADAAAVADAARTESAWQCAQGRRNSIEW